MTAFQYLQNPAEIERLSFARIRELTDLRRFDADQAQIAMRLVHTCGEPDIVDTLAFSPDAIASGLAAIQSQAALLCDVEMVRHGLSCRYVQGPAYCLLNDPQVPELAHARNETRTMAALSLWPPYLTDSLVVIGNAPTALFRLLEMLLDGAPRPALIVAMPVGFVGAAESKQALLEAELNIPWITLQGRRGGSALAVATVNALARLARGVRF